MAAQVEEFEDESWTPPAELRTHAGVEVPANMEFFVEPPPEIGELLSVHSTLRRGKNPMGATQRTVIAFAVALVLWLGTWFSLQLVDPASSTFGHILGGILGLIGLAVVFYVTSFKHTCSFIGKQGLARYVLKGSRFAEPVEELLVFEEATDLYTGQTRHYTNGVYTGTNYFFRWEDADGRKLLNLSGTFRSEKGEPEPDDPFYFAQGGEIAWSIYLLDALQKELEKHGSVEFKVNKRDAVRVGPGFMEFAFSGKEQRVDGEQLKHISIGGGTFSFKTADAKWFSSKGKFNFDYSRMSNARCFLLVLESLLGVTFE